MRSVAESTTSNVRFMARSSHPALERAGLRRAAVAEPPTRSSELSDTFPPPRLPAEAVDHLAAHFSGNRGSVKETRAFLAHGAGRAGPSWGIGPAARRKAAFLAPQVLPDSPLRTARDPVLSVRRLQASLAGLGSVPAEFRGGIPPEHRHLQRGATVVVTCVDADAWDGPCVDRALPAGQRERPSYPAALAAARTRGLCSPNG